MTAPAAPTTAVPAQPPIEPDPFGVVVDRYGMAWQRFGPGWYSAMRPLVMLGVPGRDWESLVERRGPLVVLARWIRPHDGNVEDAAAREVAAFAAAGQEP